MVWWGSRRCATKLDNSGAIQIYCNPIKNHGAKENIKTLSKSPRCWYKNGTSFSKLVRPVVVALPAPNNQNKIHRTESVKVTGTCHEQLLNRNHFLQNFDTNAYLKDFYEKVEDPAMQMCLFYLPNIAARLNEVDSLLDFGAGPTIHVACVFRNKAKNIYLADYLPQNRNELRRWMESRSTFRWDSVLKIICNREGCDSRGLKQMEDETRNKIRQILYCNCLQDPCIVMSGSSEKTFDIIVTFFTLEYCCLTRDEYQLSIHRLCKKLSKNGILIMGGILEETWCAFGGRKFSCLFITKKFVLECLAEAGMNVDNYTDEDYDNNEAAERKQNVSVPKIESNMLLFEVDGMFIIVAHKIL